MVHAEPLKILRGLEGDMGWPIPNVMRLLHIATVPRTLAKFFRPSTSGIILKSVSGYEPYRVTVFTSVLAKLEEDGTIEVLYAPTQVSQVRVTQLAEIWQELRSLFPHEARWGDHQERPVVYFTMTFLRFPKYVRRVSTLLKRYSRPIDQSSSDSEYGRVGVNLDGFTRRH